MITDERLQHLRELSAADQVATIAEDPSIIDELIYDLIDMRAEANDANRRLREAHDKLEDIKDRLR